MLITNTITQEKKQLVSQVAFTQAKNLEKEIHTALVASTQILALEIIHNDGNTDGFTTYAAEILSFSDLISNLQLAPNGIIEQIYPLAGNERAIGHNLLKDDKRLKEAKSAVQSKKLTLAGPFKLKQGGIGLVARRPIFVGPADKKQFWGFASALIMLDNLIASSDLIELSKDSLQFQLSRIHPDTGEIEQFYGKEMPLEWISASTTIDVPNNQWTLVIGLENSDRWFDLPLLKMISALIISTLLSLFFYYYATIPSKLQKAIDRKTAQLRKLANTDMLTGLDNRRRFTEVLDNLVQNADTPTEHYALLYLDLDNFKLINDQFGHHTGDQVLREISIRLNEVFESALTITRISGDEFAVIIPFQTHTDLEQLAQHAIDSLTLPINILAKNHSISASMGIVVINEDGQSATELMQNVDFSMYQAKQAGRCRYQFFDRDTKHIDDERVELLNDLKSAIHNQEFVLHYQPIYQLTDRSVHCYEALIRWQHPRRGLLTPAHFIEEAEKSDLINQIGYCVLELACQFIADNRTSQPIISINLSAKQLTDPEIYQRFVQTIEKYQISPTNLKLELTETTLMINLSLSSLLLMKFKKLGISIAIDDFGTGYSSLAVLKDLPATFIKIDKTFVDQINTSRGDLKVVQSIVALAHHLEMKVVAEGIETYEQESLLRQLKCDLGQGFLFGRPAPLNLNQTCRETS
ncbi:EAL domain-containing protein [Vibrio hepatarius]|uniref:bifunctional diguanylate cyclase/phosphodiesterase n=1 Tax=Vibrio hepatarius TaxID=171383 RepID=UPI003736F233